jgi:hypothetical protein
MSTLEAFEALVLSQQPATEPWTPVTDYSFEARKEIEGIHPQLIKDVFQPKSVFDVGAGPGHLMQMLQDLHIETAGFDANPAYTRVDDHLIVWPADIATMEIGYFGKGADLVICREVLEHLTLLQIRQAVTNICKLSSKFVYVTTRFAKQPTHLLDVETSDDLDPTHISMLNQDFLRVLFVLEGFKRRADLEEQMDWQHKGRVLVYERA